MLNIENVMFSYGVDSVLAGCTVSVASGEVLGLIGRNGAGKSTLMKLAIGQLEPQAGRIRVAGAAPDTKTARLSTMYATSNEYLPPFMTGDEYLIMLAKLYGVPAERDEYAALFARYGMGGRGRDLIEDYSHGMRKKVQLIAAFAFRRCVTLIDETINGIDVDSAIATQRDFRQLADEGKAVVLCSHDFSYMEKVCDRVVLLDEGAIVDQICAHSFTARPGLLEAWARGFISDTESKSCAI